MRLYPECNYGDFYCNHVYDPEYPWQWVDFRFFHSTLKRYFAVSMTTVIYDAYQIAEEKAWDEAEKIFPRTNSESWSVKDEINEWINRPNKDYDDRYNLYVEYKKEFLKILQLIPPSILVKDYSPIAVGVWTTVNKDFIDEHVIREWIAQYRALGEPTVPGFSWKDTPIEVTPNNI